MHILIIEDNAADAFLTRMALQDQKQNYQLTVLDDGEPAMSYLEDPLQPPVDLILLDINLPRVDGVTFLRWLRAHPRLSHLPVFILSSSPKDAYAEAAAAADKYLEKPGSLDEYMSVGEVVSQYFTAGHT